VLPQPARTATVETTVTRRATRTTSRLAERAVRRFRDA
jgi:hypothetical protein